MQRLSTSEDLEKDVSCVEHADRCGGYYIKRYLWLVASLTTLVVIFVSLFVVYALENQDARTCRLTYREDGIISEEQMQSWAADANWPLPTPFYDRRKKACVCSSSDLDPMNLALADHIPVWIAPGDLLSLAQQGDISSFPSGVNLPNSFDPKDHVKACPQHRHLIQLWGTNYQTSHCHLPDRTNDSSVERFFLGFDGALYCGHGSTEQDLCKPKYGSNPDQPLNQPFWCNGADYFDSDKYKSYQISHNRWICAIIGYPTGYGTQIAVPFMVEQTDSGYSVSPTFYWFDNTQQNNLRYGTACPSYL